MKISFDELYKMQSKKQIIPDLLHFVWIGTLYHLDIEYLLIWEKTNPDKVCQIWHDESCSFCTDFHQSIENYVKLKSLDIKKETIQLKNEAFNFIFPNLKLGLDFNTLANIFLKKKGIPVNNTTYDKKITPYKSIKNIKVKDINSIFTGKMSILKKYYYYEIILSENLASASDIVRLIVLYTHGGLYIDIDTLPYFDDLFCETNNYLKKNNINDNQQISLSKTEAFLQAIHPDVTYKKELTVHINNITKLNNRNKNEINKYIEIDKIKINLERVSSLGEIHVYKNLLAVGSLNRLKGIYYNNVIASHPGSKSISIIIRSLKKRYRFLEKNNAIFEIYQDKYLVHYLARLLNWRKESLTHNHHVTPILTGPGLIVEVMLGLAYELIELNVNIQPYQVAEIMQNDKFGIAFLKHTLDTPQGLNSAWRKGDNDNIDIKND